MSSRYPVPFRAVLRRAVIAVLFSFLGLGIAVAQGDPERALQAEIHRKQFREYKALAEQGDPKAQMVVGMSYLNAVGVQQDFAEAVRWLRISAKQGNTLAQSALGCCYSAGLGVSQDFEAAVKWHRTSAENGNYGGMRNLARCYRDAQGVDKNDVEAYAWFDLANKTIKDEEKDPGEDDRNRENLEEKMTPEQIAEGKKRSKELKAQIEAKLKSAGK